MVAIMHECIILTRPATNRFVVSGANKPSHNPADASARLAVLRRVPL